MPVAERVAIGLVGAGRMGRVHLQVLQRSELIELAGVVEPVVAIREALAAEQVAAYEDARGLLAADRLDGVVIAAPSDQHPELVAEFAAAGIPILCEKPLGVNVADAERAMSAAHNAGVSLQVGYWRRYVSALRSLRGRIAAGELGEIYQLSCMQWDHEPPGAEFRAHSGGIAIDMAVHEIDQTRWLLGQEVESVAATGAGRLGGTSPRDPDAAVILARLSGGAAATISLGRSFPHEDSCWVEVWGSDGYERAAFMWAADGERVFLDALTAQAHSFAGAIRGGPIDGAGGQDAVAALNAAQRAALALEGTVALQPVHGTV
jgi:myo-inositol 2-dehydrogenase/D-chiro-inositol 1-dehydrogenase